VTRRATKLDEFRDRLVHVLVLDAGDSLVGDGNLADRSKGATSVEAMNRLGYDAAALGPKDLALGEEVLRKRMAEARFAFLSANVRAAGTGELLAQAYVVREIGGHRVAIIGLTEKADVPGFIIDDPLETLRRLVPEVAATSDIVILLTHTPASQTRQLLQAVQGIDIAVSGGVEPLPDGEMVGEAFLVHADVPSPGHAGRYLGLVTAVFDGQGRLAEHNQEIIALMEDIPEDPAMLDWLINKAPYME
jgi:2',3'-cyclic-nucleotide 2'-phosphodiesterase (5'-nucleotidase family)